MKKLNYSMLIVLTVAMAFVSSCKKDETPVTPVNCQLTKIDITVFGQTVTSTLTYNGAGQVIDMQTNDVGTISGTQYTYTAAGKVATMEEYEGATKEVTSKIVYTYGANGVTEEKMYTDNAGNMELTGVNRFDYTGTQMSRKNVFEIVGGNEVKTEYMDYSYMNGDVKVIVTYTEDAVNNWVATSRTSYSYNDKTPSRFLIGLMTEDPNFPANHYITVEKEETYNTLTQTWEETSELDYVYSFDSNGNPTKINAGQGLYIIDLSYTCN